jgi:hypothetical protein
MVGRDGVLTSRGRGPWGGRPVVVGLGVVAVLAVATAVLVALLGVGTATAQTGTDPGPQPYGGQLEKVDETDRVTSEQVLEVGMLALGTLNGVAFVIAMVASRLRGPSTAQTRRALIARTGAGVVSESRRERRERLRSRGAAPGPAVHATAPGTRPAMGPSAQAPRTPPPGAVPAQGGPAPREGLVPAGRAPLGPDGRPGAAPASPPAGVPAPVRPSGRQ